MPDDVELNQREDLPRRGVSAHAFDRRLRLNTLGELALVNHSGERQLASGHRTKLVLLAVLALTDGPVTRDALVEMFWDDEPDRRSGRHSLSNTLSFLRGALGRDAITMHRAEILLAPRILDVDAVELLDASRSRNMALVLNLYRGRFLDAGSGRVSPVLDRWVAETRERIVRTVSQAANLCCARAAAAHDWESCTRAARTWLSAEPGAPEATLHLLVSLAAPGTPDARRAALAEYDRLSDGQAQEGRTMPDARVAEFARRLQARVAAEWPADAWVSSERPGPSVVAPTETTPGEAAPAMPAEARSTATTAEITDETEERAHADLPLSAGAPLGPSTANRVAPGARRWGAIGATALVAAALVLVAGRTTWSLPTRTTTHERPVIAITDIGRVSSDTTSAWLDAGLAQMLATDLARFSALEIIVPSRIQDLRRRAELPPAQPLSQSQAVDLGRRAGATLILRGTLTTGQGALALSIVERDVKSGEITGSFNVMAADPITLVDRATARLLNTVAAADGSRRARFADIETSSAAAYQHFVRSEQAVAEGRYFEQQRELDAAIALDPAFGSALLARREAPGASDDSATAERLTRALAGARFTAWDMQEQAVDSAWYNGENTRSEQLARALVMRYPHDPRAYTLLGDVYKAHGKFAEADGVYRRELSLDSLGDEAGRGPCVPCSAYALLATLQAFDGHLAAARQTTERWLQLQPDVPAAYSELAGIFSFQGQYDAALDAAGRARALSGGDPVYAGRHLRLLIMARQFQSADSLIAEWTKPATPPPLREAAEDAAVQLARERGELRSSLRMLARAPLEATSLFERLDGLSRLGEYVAAARLFSADIGRLDGQPSEAAGGAGQSRPLVGSAARDFAWSRAIEAEAIAGAGDTLRLRALADSIQDASGRSYYGRDWRLEHHVAGRIAMLGKRYAEAEREFAAAQWGAAGWTVNLAWEARAQLAQHRPLDAVATLRRAYEGPLDAMGRYEPRSDLDYLMTVAFTAAGRTDSAAVYRSYVEASWRHADPEIRRLLAALGPTSHGSIASRSTRLDSKAGN